MSTVEFPYFVIEHHENEDFPKDGWCMIEYTNILRVCTPQRVIITNMDACHWPNLPPIFKSCAAITDKSIIEFLSDANNRENHLDQPHALTHFGQQEPSQNICFLDEHGTGPLEPEDLGKFKYIIVGGILGDHPPKDRGGHLRGHGFAVRHLGPRQMSTDTAVLACCAVLKHQVRIDDLLYIDDPEVYSDEIDSIPRSEDGHNATKTSKGKRESTRIRMRYLTHQQPAIDSKSPQDFPQVTTVDRSQPFSAYIEREKGEQQGDLPSPVIDAMAGDWYASKTPKQKELYRYEPALIPRITPGLLDHIFSTLDDALLDFDGGIEFLDEELTPEELASLNLFEDDSTNDGDVYGEGDE